MQLKNKKYLIGVGILIVVLGVTWNEFQKHQQGPHKIVQELNEIATKGEKFSDPKEALNSLGDLEINEANLARATFLITSLVTLEEPTERKNKVKLPADWLVHKNNVPLQVRNSMTRWENRMKASTILRYVMNLYAENYGQTREVIHYFLSSPHRVSYFDLFIADVARNQYHLSIPITYMPNELSAKSKSDLKRIFQDKQLIDWAKSRPTDFKQYAGWTNTIIGIYDWISYDQFRTATGFDQFPQSAEAYLDLGGGFATPDISRLIGKEFTSLDLISPKDAKDWGLYFQELIHWRLPEMSIKETRIQTPAEREAYLNKLAATKWLYSDVFVTPLPDQFSSYFITSFGFLSSTVVSQSENSPYSKIKLAPFYVTSYVATHRIVELIVKGKAVDLFAYQRASERKYRYRTAFLSFRNHRLVTQKFFPENLPNEDQAPIEKKLLVRNGEIQVVPK